MRRALAAAVTLLLLSCSAARAPLVAPHEKHRGMSYAGAFSRERDIRYGSAASMESLRKLDAMGVEWISIMPFGFMDMSRDASLRWGGRNLWEPHDALAATTRQAHSLGMRVLLKPHLWIRNEREMTPAELQTFLADYERFIVDYAELAREIDADAFAMGNEVKFATHEEAAWRRMIGRVRSIYRGPLTYGANFDEVHRVPFWDALDWIGVSGYFPLVDAPTPDRASLVRAWEPVLTQLEELSVRTGKPVLFTEIGYRSSDGAAWRQWELPRDARLNLEAQRVAYEAFFETVWPRPWVLGAYPWKWFSYSGHSDASSNDYEVENKPAAEVIERVYRRR